MIAWKLSTAEVDRWEATREEIEALFAESGLIVGAGPDFASEPFPDEVAGVPFDDILFRVSLGGGGGGAVDPKQVIDLLVNVWPYLKITAAAALAGASAKAGADAWDLCKQGLKSTLHQIADRHRGTVTVEVVHDSDVEHDFVYLIPLDAPDTLDAALDAIAEHARAHRRRPRRERVLLRWDAVNKTLDRIDE